MSAHTPVLCPHGRATSWQGTVDAGDTAPLPTCEWCPECDPDAVLLDPLEAS